MRKIENKKFTVDIEKFTQVEDKLIHVSSSKESCYFEIIHSMLKTPPKSGWNDATLDRLRTRLLVLSSFDNKELGKIALIEEHDYEEIMIAYREWTWGIMSQDVVDFCDYIKSVKKETINNENVQ